MGAHRTSTEHPPTRTIEIQRNNATATETRKRTRPEAPLRKVQSHRINTHAAEAEKNRLRHTRMIRNGS